MADVRLRPGRDVVVIDLSRGGALVEADSRLLPGIRVELQFDGPDGRWQTEGRVLRCEVVTLDGHLGVRYRGALAFDRMLER